MFWGLGVDMVDRQSVEGLGVSARKVFGIVEFT